ncbi:MAG: hypothetical protein U0984_11065 [Prosthecobacter sp.]|nr:hypothetical protein [Prosthecobacter sp.]
MKPAFIIVLLFCGLPWIMPAAEDLSAPPVTTARAWAIADGGAGKIIASEHGNEPQKSASTTKIMGALVVLNLAQYDPAVLDEMVTISKLADATEGSTAEVKAGEKISVREGLYGLLLPSGNDMGNALAEHLNARLQPPGKESPAKLAESAYRTRRNFIAEMNRMATRLGMHNTCYRLPYGDGGTADDRTTTAEDLVLLAHEAMKNPLFRAIVKTTEYTGKVRLPKGGTRSLHWENTNLLLKLGAYDGIKTGKTPSARFCLVARGEHEGRLLIVVVLGAASDESRFADARNLFRWAWANKK